MNSRIRSIKTLKIHTFFYTFATDLENIKDDDERAFEARLHFRIQLGSV